MYVLYFTIFNLSDLSALSVIKPDYSDFILASKSSKILDALESYIFSIRLWVDLEPTMYNTTRTGVAIKSVITVNMENSLRFDFFTLDVVGERILLTVSWSGVWGN